MNQANQRVVIVLGMHRSGTSAVTRGLQVMGVNLGEKLMPAVKDVNAKGFWEDLDFYAINYEMLSFLKSGWDHLVPIGPREVEALHEAGYLTRAAKLLRTKIGDSPIFALKDPRVAKLLPFWKTVFSHSQLKAVYLLVIRHPLSVVKSLLRRNGFDTQKSYLLWLCHVIPSLSCTEGETRVLVDYDLLMQAPEHELEKIAGGLGLKINPEEMQIYKSGFLDSKLRHTAYSLDDLLLDDTCPPLVREIYAALLDVASEKTQIDDADLQGRVSNWVDEYDRLNSQSLLSLVDRLSAEIGRRDKIIAEQETKIRNILASRAWRLTRPLRYLAQIIRERKNAR
jgi:hypothetical protein